MRPESLQKLCCSVRLQKPEEAEQARDLDLRGEDFIEGFWDGPEWLSMIIWGVLPGLAAAASRFEYQGQLWPPKT